MRRVRRLAGDAGQRVQGLLRKVGLTRSYVLANAHAYNAVFNGSTLLRANLSGAKAEAAAKRLGVKLAESGEPVEIRVLLRDGSLAGRFQIAPAAADLALVG